MTLSSRFHKPLLLVLLAFSINLIFLYFYNPKYHFTVSQLHGQVGYNINAYGSVCLNDALTKDMHDRRNAHGQLADFNHIESKKYTAPTKPFITNDTIGYGLILGLIWKITQSFSFIDVQWLQIIIFSLLMILLYQIVFILFGSESIAFIGCIAHLFYFPIIAMNVQPVRDIWAYYGVIILLYGMFRYCFQIDFPHPSTKLREYGKSVPPSSLTLCQSSGLKDQPDRRSLPSPMARISEGWFEGSTGVHKRLNISLCRFVLCGIGFGICQFVRPSVFLALLTLSFIFLIYGLIRREKLRKIITMLGFLIFTNVLCFWIPFMVYNKISYNRYFVGPVGVDLLEGLGEFPNTWGYKLDDVWISDYITKKYQVIPGTPEFDDKAHEEFSIAFNQEPSTYFINILKRLPGLIFPGLPWVFYMMSPYGDGIGLYEKVTKIVSSTKLFIDFLIRHVYIRLYLLLGYLGAIFLLFQRRYWIVALLAGVILGGLGKLPSHIEYRYLVPYYWVFGIFCAYAFDTMKKRFQRIQTK